MNNRRQIIEQEINTSIKKNSQGISIDHCIMDMQRGLTDIRLNGNLLLDLVATQAGISLTLEEQKDVDKFKEKLNVNGKSLHELLTTVLTKELCSTSLSIDFLSKYLHQHALLFCVTKGIVKSLQGNDGNDPQYLFSGEHADIKINISRQKDDSILITETVKVNGLGNPSSPHEVTRNKDGALMEVSGDITVSVLGEVTSSNFKINSYNPIIDQLFGDRPQPAHVSQATESQPSRRCKFTRLIAFLIDLVTCLGRCIRSSLSSTSNIKKQMAEARDRSNSEQPGRPGPKS